MPISETYNLDVMEYLKGVEDDFFDLALADPNYGISVNHNKMCIRDRVYRVLCFILKIL